jgi:hypothetical protein
MCPLDYFDHQFVGLSAGLDQLGDQGPDLQVDLAKLVDHRLHGSGAKPGILFEIFRWVFYTTVHVDLCVFSVHSSSPSSQPM